MPPIFTFLDLFFYFFSNKSLDLTLDWVDFLGF